MLSMNMSNTSNSVIGYGPSQGRLSRLYFDGVTEHYELWETKFFGYLRLRSLDAVLRKNGALEGQEIEQNKDIFAELIQVLDDTSLSLIIRDAHDDGIKSLKILREHYCGSGKTRILSLYATLTSLEMEEGDSTTDYVLKAEKAWTALKNAGEQLSDSLIVAMLLKGLPETYKAFEVFVTQSEKEYTVTQFKKALREYEAHQKPEDSVLKVKVGVYNGGAKSAKRDLTCFNCRRKGHIAKECRKKKSRWCDICRNKSHDTEYCKKKSVEKNTVQKDKVAVVDLNFKVAVIDNLNRVSDEHSDDVRTLVDCGATAHIVTDASKFEEMDSSFDPSSHIIELADGSRTSGAVRGRGKAKIEIMDESGQPRTVTLNDALFIPSYSKDILSVQAATARGAKVSFTKESAYLEAQDGTVFPISKRGRLYYLCAAINVKARPAEIWHQALGHLNEEDLRKLPAVSENMCITGKRDMQCETCIQGKMTKTFNRTPDEKAKKPLMKVHSDLAGPINTKSKNGYRYVMNFVDDFSGCSFVYFLKNKNDACLAIEKFIADVAPYGEIKCMRSDNGTEYVNKRVREILVKNKIKHEKCSPYSPHQNGTAERHWLTLFNTARCLLIESGIDKSLWHYAVLAANYARNRSFNRRLQITPAEAFTGKRPDLSRLHVFGSVCYAYVENKGKLDARCQEGLFLGYDKESPAYLVLSPDNVVKKVRCVKFTDRLPYEPDDSEEFVRRNKGQDVSEPTNVKDESNVKDKSKVKDESNVESDDEHIPEYVEGDAKNDEIVQNDDDVNESSQRSSKRERRKPGHLDDYVTYVTDEGENLVLLITCTM